MLVRRGLREIAIETSQMQLYGKSLKESAGSELLHSLPSLSDAIMTKYILMQNINKIQQRYFETGLSSPM
jgi:hypothetical protein